MAHKKGKSKHLSVSKLSRMSAKDLRELDHLRFVVHKHETLAVLIPYGQYREIVEYARKAMDVAIEIPTDIDRHPAIPEDCDGTN